MPLDIHVREDLGRLANTLGEIQRVTGKTGQALVADAAVQFAIGGNGVRGMFQRLRAVRPEPDAITRAAQARGWRVRITHEAAKDRAFAAWRGQSSSSSSLLFRLGKDRASTRDPNRIKRGNLKRVVIDRKTGRLRNERSLKAEAGVSNFERTAATVGDRLAKGSRRNAVSLNMRAAEVHWELKMREASRGYLASSYAHKGIKAMTRRKEYHSDLRAKDGRLTGSADFMTGDGAAIASFANNFPATRSNPDAMTRDALAAVMADKEAYLSRKLLENFTKIR